MAAIKPLACLRYNQEVVKDLSTVIAPPYDVISKEKQIALYDASPYNIIRLELGNKRATDDENNNVYTRASDLFNKWQQERVLCQEDTPAFYLYQQEFHAAGRKLTRTGFIAGIKAAGYSKGHVLPHEETLPKHKADRLELMRHTFANFSPIFGLYPDRDKIIDQALLAQADREPDVNITDWAGEKHRIWVIKDAATIAKVQAEMAKLTVYIADGHHRYETACTFAEEQPECDHIMMSLVNLYDDGLIILPTHRLMKNIAGYNLSTLLKNLAEDFIVGEIAPVKTKEESLDNLLFALKESGKKGPSFGFYGGNDKYYLLRLKDPKLLDTIHPEKDLALRSLDVSVLHNFIIEKLLGVGPKELAAEGFVVYTRDDMEAISMVDDGLCQCSLIMNPTKIEEMMDVSGAGEKMPQKSTYFYPKIIAGLTLNKLK